MFFPVFFIPHPYLAPVPNLNPLANDINYKSEESPRNENSVDESAAESSAESASESASETNDPSWSPKKNKDTEKKRNTTQKVSNSATHCFRCEKEFRKRKSAINGEYACGSCYTFLAAKRKLERLKSEGIVCECGNSNPKKLTFSKSVYKCNLCYDKSIRLQKQTSKSKSKTKNPQRITKRKFSTLGSSTSVKHKEEGSKIPKRQSHPLPTEDAAKLLCQFANDIR